MPPVTAVTHECWLPTVRWIEAGSGRQGGSLHPLPPAPVLIPAAVLIPAPVLDPAPPAPVLIPAPAPALPAPELSLVTSAPGVSRSVLLAPQAEPTPASSATSH